MTKQLKKIESIVKDIGSKTESSDIKEELKAIIENVEDVKQEKKELRNETLRMYRFIYQSSSATKIKEQFKKDLKACGTIENVEMLYNKYIPYIWVNKTYKSSLTTLTELRNIIKETRAKMSRHALEITFALGYINAKGTHKENKTDIYSFRDNEKNVKVKTVKNVENKPTDDFKPTDIKQVVLKLEDIIKNFDDYTGEDTNSVVVAYRANEKTKRVIKAYYISFLLAITTGRRFAEILGELKIGSEISKLKHEHRRKVPTFKGISKKGSEESDRAISNRSLDASTSTKILFISIDKAQRYLKELRTLIKTTGMTSKEITNKYNAMFNKAFKDRFLTNNPNIDKKYQLNIKTDGKLLLGEITKNNGKKGNPTFHTLRSIYAVTAYKIEKEKNPKLDLNKYEFGASVLLQVYNASASENYMEL